MDKPSKTITIKINGKNHEVEDQHPLENETPGSFNPSIELEENSKQTAATNENLEESFDWILPELDEKNEIKEYKIESYPKKKKNSGLLSKSINGKLGKNKGVFSTIFFTIFFAVLLGTSFGFLILKLLVSDQPIEPSAPVTANPVTSEDPNKKQSGETVTLTLNPIYTNVVQHGVYSTEESANQVLSSLQGKGIQGSSLESNGKFFVLLGASDNIEHAKELGNQLKSNEIEVFAKPIEIKGKELKDLHKQEADLLKVVPDLYSQLSTAAGAGIVSSQVSTEVITGIIEKGKTVSQISEENIKNEKIKKLKQHIGSGVTKVESYQKSSDIKHLKELQGDLLAILALYQSL